MLLIEINKKLGEAISDLIASKIWMVLLLATKLIMYGPFSSSGENTETSMSSYNQKK